MITLILILTVLNTIGIAFHYIQKFKETYTICSKEVYDTLLEYWGEYHDEDGNEITRELAGGCGVETGFFREALYDDEEEEEEE